MANRRHVECSLSIRSRTSFPEATKTVLKTIGKEEDSLTVSRLIQSTGLDRRTVEKVIETILETQKVLTNTKIKMEKVNNMRVLRLEDKSGMLSLPDPIQKLMIRSLYFPSTSREEELLANLYMRNATSKKNALKLDDVKLVNRLLKQGQILSTAGRKFYLSKEGIMVAKGALDIYPELGQMYEKFVYS